MNVNLQRQETHLRFTLVLTLRKSNALKPLDIYFIPSSHPESPLLGFLQSGSKYNVSFVD